MNNKLIKILVTIILTLIVTINISGCATTYTVRFETKGSIIESQQVKMMKVPTKPSDPTRAGYTFKGWDYNFSDPIKNNTIIKAIWEDNYPGNFYQVEADSVTDNTYFCIDARISTTNSRNIKEIWINLTDINSDSINITLSKGFQDKTLLFAGVILSKKQVETDEDGWFKLYSGDLKISSPGFYGELKIGFSSEIKVRELLILDKQLQSGRISVHHCSTGPQPTAEYTGGYVEVEGADLSLFDKISDGVPSMVTGNN